MPPQKVKRRKYYQTGGPDNIWAMDQNEKVGMFGFKILCAVDGFSRYPVHWEVRLARPPLPPLLLSLSPLPSFATVILPNCISTRSLPT